MDVQRTSIRGNYDSHLEHTHNRDTHMVDRRKEIPDKVPNTHIIDVR